MENMELYIKQWQILNNYENLICYGQNYVNIPKTKVNCSFWLGINYQLFTKTFRIHCYNSILKVCFV